MEETEAVVAETVAAESVAAETVAAETVAAETVAAETVAAETVAAETVAAETVAAETVAAETVAAETVAAETVAAENVTHIYTEQDYYDAKKNLNLPPEDQQPENLNFDMDPKRLPAEIRNRQMYSEQTTKVMNLLDNLAENGLDDEHAVRQFRKMAEEKTAFEEFYYKQKETLINNAKGFRFINNDEWGVCMIIIENDQGKLRYRNYDELSEVELKNLQNVSSYTLEDCYNFIIKFETGTEWQLFQEKII